MNKSVAAMLSFFLCIFTFVIISCSESEEIVIGAIVPLTSEAGKPLDLGLNFVSGLELAAENINDSGGVNNKNIKLIYLDCRSDSERAKSDFIELLKFSPVAVITMQSHVALAVKPFATEYKIPQIATVSLVEDLVKGSPYTYRYWPTASDMAGSLCSLLKRLKINKLGIIYQSTSYGESVAEELQKMLKEKGKETRTKEFSLVDKRLENELVELDDCDAIYFICYSEKVKEMALLVGKMFPDKPIIGPDTIASPLFSMSPEVNGFYTSAPLIYNNSYPFAVEVREKYKAKTGHNLSHVAAAGFDVVNLLAQLMANGNDTSETLKFQLDRDFIYPGLFGDFRKQVDSREMAYRLYPVRIVNKSVVYQER